MSKVLRRAALPVVAAIAAILLTATPSAAAISDVTVTFTADDPRWGSIGHSAPCPISGSAAPYREVTLNVSASGTYAISAVRDAGQSQGLLAIRRADGSCPLAFPVFNQAVLGQGTHRAIVAGVTNLSTVTFRFDGPGTVSLVPELPADLSELCTWDPKDIPAPYTAVVGTSKVDRLTGTSAPEVFFAGAGNDRVDGGGGDDVVCGEAGQDTLFGGTGDDLLVGGEGQDVLNGGTGEDVLLGGAGNDVLNGDEDADLLVGGDDRDELRGGAGDDELRGGAGNDVHDGGAGTDLAVDTVGRDVFRNVESRG